MKYQIVASTLALAAIALAAPSADALPWANANSQAAAAAKAYADAYAEAEAIGHADPDAFALAASADDCASIACHAACGLLIIEAQSCSGNSENTYKGPYDTSCLCSEGSAFMSHYAPCMECGWTLWKYYGVYVEDALAACPGLSTEPTGTLRCSTTLTDAYTPDYNIEGCSYLGNCPEKTDDAKTTAEEPTTTAEEPATTAADTTETPKQTTGGHQPEEETTTAEQPATETAGEKTTAMDQTRSGETTVQTPDKTTAAQDSTAQDSTIHAVSTFEGAATKVGAAAGAAIAGAFLLF